jgi:hypothetical protein
VAHHHRILGQHIKPASMQQLPSLMMRLGWILKCWLTWASMLARAAQQLCPEFAKPFRRKNVGVI